MTIDFGTAPVGTPPTQEQKTQILNVLGAAPSSGISPLAISGHAMTKAVGFMDRFNRTDRYTSGQAITHMVSMPEIGDAWRLSLPSDNIGTPSVTGGSFHCPQNNTLAYLGSRVPTQGGKMYLAFDFELASTNLANAIFNDGLNVSFASATMITDEAEINPIGVVHINFSTVGIQSIGIYGGTSLTRVDGTGLGWFSDVTQTLLLNRRYTLFLFVEGNYLTVGIVGIGSMLFYHPDLSTKIGADYTNFWWEPGGPVLGSNIYLAIAKLYRVWGGSDALAFRPDFGTNESGIASIINGQTFHTLPAIQTRLVGAPLLAESFPITPRLVARGTNTTSRGGGQAKANGGHTFIDGRYLMNFGSTTVGGGLLLSAPGVNKGRTSSVSSSAGAGTVIEYIKIDSLSDAGEFEEHKVYGRLVGAGNKSIVLRWQTYGGNLFDSGTALNGLSGVFEIVVMRTNLSGATHTAYTKMTVNGTVIGIQRIASNLGDTGIANIEFFTTTADAGGVIIDQITNQYAKPNLT